MHSVMMEKEVEGQHLRAEQLQGRRQPEAGRKAWGGLSLSASSRSRPC